MKKIILTAIAVLTVAVVSSNTKQQSAKVPGIYTNEKPANFRNDIGSAD